MIDYIEQNGAIWELIYFTKNKIEIPSEETDKFVDRQTREFGNIFNPPAGLSSQAYSELFMLHFMKSREESRELLDKNSVYFQRTSEQFQLGNRECLAAIESLEKSPNFHAWEDGTLVNYFKHLSTSFL